MKDDIGAQFFGAMFEGDHARARSLLAVDAVFDALTPGGVYSARNAAATIDNLADLLTPRGTPRGFGVHPFHGRHRASYTVVVGSPAGADLIYEQTAYFDIRDGRITALQLLCSGDLPAAVDAP